MSNIFKKIYGYRDGKRFIIDTEPVLKKYTDIELMRIASIEEKLMNILEDNIRNKRLINGLREEEADKLLEWVIQNTRQQLNDDGNISKNSLLGYCGIAQSIIVATLKGMALRPNISNVNPTITRKGYRHAFVTVAIPVKRDSNIKNKLYLIDATYRQFFLRDEVTTFHGEYIKDKKYGNKVAPLAGYWAIKMPNGIKFSEELLSKGFIELTEENAKIYGDSFVLEIKKRADYTKVPSKKEMITGIRGREYIENMIDSSLQEEVEHYPMDLRAVGVNINTPRMQKEGYKIYLNSIEGKENQIIRKERQEK